MNTRGPVVYAGVNKGRDEQDGLQPLVNRKVVYMGV